MYKVTLYEDSNDVVGTVIHQPHINGTKLTSGNIAQGINVVNSFTFSLNMQSSMYTKVKPRKTMVKVTNTKTGNDEFNGYVLRLNSTMSDNGMFNKSFTAVDGMNYLKETSQPFAEIRNTTPRDFLQIILNNHNAATDNHKKFLLGTVNVTNSTDNVYRFLSQEANTFDTIFDKLVDSLGGELRTRLVDGQWYLDWLTAIGETKQTEIRIGRNLKSQDRDEDTESVVTRWYFYGATLDYKKGVIDTFETLGDGTNVAVIEIDGEVELLSVNANLMPAGSDVGSYIFISGDYPNYIVILRGEFDEAPSVSKPRISISDVNNGKAYIDDVAGIAQFGVVSGREVFDDVNTPSLLLTKGIQFVANYKQVTVSNQVTAYDLSLIGKDVDSYEVYNSYPLNNIGIAEKETVRIVEKRIDINNPQSSTLTIGDKFQTASQYQATAKASAKSIKALQTTVNNQSLSISTLKSSNVEMTTKYNAVQVSYNNLATTLEIDDVTGTSVALTDLKTSIDDLTVTITGYDFADMETRITALENASPTDPEPSPLFNMTTITSVYIDSDGSEKTSFELVKTSDFIQIDPIVDYKYTQQYNNTNSATIDSYIWIACYNTSKAFISHEWIPKGTIIAGATGQHIENITTFPTNTVYMRIGGDAFSSATLTVI